MRAARSFTSLLSNEPPASVAASPMMADRGVRRSCTTAPTNGSFASSAPERAIAFHASADLAAFRDLSLNDLSRACSASGNAAIGAWISARVERRVVHDPDQMGVSDVFAHVVDQID